MAQHTSVVEPPIRTSYRGYTVCQTGLPSQGLILLEALNLAEQADPAALARGDAAAVHLLAEILKCAYADRLGHAQDPKFAATPLDWLLSKRFAAQRFAGIDRTRASAATVPAMQDGDTTYLCTADASGMMVSLIQSVSSAFGSGMIAGDTGVILNNRVGRGFSLVEGHPNHYAPGKKPMSTLNCYSAMDGAGEAVLVGGTYGGDGQPQWGLQALVGLIDGGLDVQAACEIPRWSNFPGTDPANLPSPYRLLVETRLGEATLRDLAAMGHTLEITGEWAGGGGANIIARDPATGVLAGGSDPRVEGMPIGL
jgi:gamma-glutamyltranspeptidase